MLGILDRRLAAREYLLGDRFTLTDLIVGNGVLYSTFAGVSTTDHPHVERWLARFQTRPSFKKVAQAA